MSKKTYYYIKEIEDLLESASMVVTSIGRKFYHLPYWFEEKPGGGYFVHHLDELPDDLKEFITKAHLGGDNPQPMQSYKYEILDISNTDGTPKRTFRLGEVDDLIKGDPSKPVVEIWMEGYRATGESATANMLNQYHADSFDEAMKLYMEDNPGDVDVKKIPKNSKSVRDYSFTKQYSIWACRLFDNETDARKSFG